MSLNQEVADVAAGINLDKLPNKHKYHYYPPSEDLISLVCSSPNFSDPTFLEFLHSLTAQSHFYGYAKRSKSHLYFERVPKINLVSRPLSSSLGFQFDIQSVLDSVSFFYAFTIFLSQCTISIPDYQTILISSDRIMQYSDSIVL